jgi:hypothetical protein
MMAKRCSVCGRRPGHQDKARDRYGAPDPNPETPLGELRPCHRCGLLDVCPDCFHELDCCELKPKLKGGGRDLSGREDGKMRM